MDRLGINRNTVREYWESYERSLNGGEWRVSREETFSLELMQVMAPTLCILIAIFILVLIFCLTKKRKRNTMDTERMWMDLPTYDEVIKLDMVEMKNLKDLPSYQDAVRKENETKVPLWTL